MRPLIVLTAVTGLLTTAGCGGGVEPSTDRRSGSAATESVSEISGGPDAQKAVETADFQEGSRPEGMSADMPAGDESASVGRHSTATPERHPSHSDSHSAPADRQPRIQSGSLTAGSLDDHTGYNDFLQYVHGARNHVTGQTLAEFDGRQIPIHVVGAQGRPIADARVSILPIDSRSDDSQARQLRYAAVPESQPRAVTLRTGSDGRAALVPSLDGTGRATNFEVVVTTAAGVQVTRKLSLEQREWTIQVDQQDPALPQQLDLALVIDTTGSMGDELAWLKVEIDSIAAQIKQLFPNVDQRYALILYRDNGDEYVTRTFDFSGSLD